MAYFDSPGFHFRSHHHFPPLGFRLRKPLPYRAVVVAARGSSLLTANARSRPSRDRSHGSAFEKVTTEMIKQLGEKEVLRLMGNDA
jgi:hypothetical protein